MAPSAFPIDEAYLIAGWLESFLWGLYTFIFAVTIRDVYVKRKDRFNKFTTSVIVILYVLAVAHVSLALARLVEGFVIYRDTIGPVQYFANIALRINLVKDYLYLAIGDLVIVWRLYVIWGQNVWVVVFPVLMSIGELICGYAGATLFLFPDPSLKVVDNWGTALLAISLTTNVFVTLMIVLRIWYISSRTRNSVWARNNPYARLLLLIIESGALISAAKGTEIVLFQVAPGNGLSGNNALYIVYDAMPQITGIVPTLIILAVLRGFTRPDECYTTFRITDLRFASTTTAQETTMDSDTPTYTVELSQCRRDEESSQKEHEHAIALAV